MTNFASVKKFMETFGQEVKEKAEFPSNKIVKLRYDLIKEELDEFEEAIKQKNLKMKYKKIKSCSLCGSKKIRKLIDFGPISCSSTFPKNDKDEVPTFVKDQIINLKNLSWLNLDFQILRLRLRSLA